MGAEYYVRSEAMTPAGPFSENHVPPSGFVKVRLAGSEDPHSEALSRVHSHLIVLSDQQEAILAILKARARRAGRRAQRA